VPVADDEVDVLVSGWRAASHESGVHEIDVAEAPDLSLHSWQPFFMAANWLGKDLFAQPVDRRVLGAIADDSGVRVGGRIGQGFDLLLAAAAASLVLEGPGMLGVPTRAAVRQRMAETLATRSGAGARTAGA